MSLPVSKRGEIISGDTRSIISTRYRTVTRAINQEFWNSKSETQNSLYVGSYGRGTAINTSDLDILVELPVSEYNRYDISRGNGQSRLLQAVRSAILITYSRSDIRADGQVVKISFWDGMRFEILPAFRNFDFLGRWNGTYVYPDSNMGGNWRSTNPKAEQEAMKQKNNSSNGLLYDTCKHLRSVRDNYFSSYKLSGIVIDSFVYEAIGNWRWTPDGESSSAASGDYERILYNHLHQKILSWPYNSIKAPGSGQQVDASSSIECLKKVVDFVV